MTNIEFINLFENDVNRIPETKDKYSSNNFILTRPRGIILTDTYNNPFFPIRPYPQIDTCKSNIDLINLRYCELYTQTKTELLPWHYFVELVNDKYRVYQTRPINMKFPISHQEALDRKDKLEFNVPWNEETTNYMNNPAFQLEDAIHICIAGDSNKDIYSRDIYDAIGLFCFRPIMYWFKQERNDKYQIKLNLGPKFRFEKLSRFLFK